MNKELEALISAVRESGWQHNYAQTQALATACEQLQARVSELETALAEAHDWISRQAPHSSTLHVAQRVIERRLARVSELEAENERQQAFAKEYIEQTDPIIACGSADDPSSEHCGQCRACLIEENDALKLDAQQLKNTVDTLSDSDTVRGIVAGLNDVTAGRTKPLISVPQPDLDAIEYKLVLIEWVDSYGCTPSWEAIGSCKAAPMVVKSVGWLFQDDEDCKVIIPHLSEANHPNGEQQGCGDMTIPTKAILSMTELNIASKLQARVSELEKAQEGMSFDDYRKKYGVVSGGNCRKCGASLTCPCLCLQFDPDSPC